MNIRIALSVLSVACLGLVISSPIHAQELSDETTLCTLELARAAQLPAYKDSEKNMREVIKQCRGVAGSPAQQLERAFVYSVAQQDPVAAAHLARLKHESTINYPGLFKGLAIMSATAFVSYYAGKQRGSSSSSGSN